MLKCADQNLLGLFTDEQSRVIRFYPGGDLMDFLHLVHKSDNNSQPTNTHYSSLAVRWVTVTNRTSLFNLLSGMLCTLLVSSFLYQSTKWACICLFLHTSTCTHNLR